MAPWKIELWDARGDRPIGTIVVKVPNREKAEQHAARVFRRRLSGAGDIYFEAKGNQTYAVTLGQEEIGQARITRCTRDSREATPSPRVRRRACRRTRGALVAPATT
jgi:hypothetical protein